MFALMALGIIYLGLFIAFVQQLYFLLKEKFDKFRLMSLGLIATVLALTFFYPFGLINFDRLSGEDLLVAQAEGSANCMTTLKLKDNNTFIERSVCFGVTETKGRYKIVHDTIYFEKVKLGREIDTFYKFALLKPSTWNVGKVNLVRFVDMKDTIGRSLQVTQNNLFDSNGQKSTR